MRLTRPLTYGERGMVATPHYLASITALDVLRQGGSAVDAALSAVATLGTVIPHMTSIGGDAFWLIYEAASGKLFGIDGSGTAGARATIETFGGEAEIPDRGPRAVLTVPGAVDSWRLAHERFGKLPLARLLEPAIDYAARGSPVSAGLADWTRESAVALAEDQGARELFLPGGTALTEGARLEQRALARTLAMIAEDGPRAFYEKTAHSIAAYLGAHEGLLGTEDFARYRALCVEPISVRYRGARDFQLPPPSQGLAELLILRILGRRDLARLGIDSPAYFDALIEAIRTAFRERDTWLADPRFCPIPLAKLLDPSGTERLERAGTADGPRPFRGGDTVFVAAADRDGNAVGVVQSLYFDFGAAVLDPESGVLLQNRGASFSLDPKSANALSPGKRPASTLMAGMLFDQDRPVLIHGTQGGEGQAQTNTCLLTRFVDFGCDVQRAIEAPRLLWGRSWGDSASQLLIETNGGSELAAELRKLGHAAQAVPWPNPKMGTAQAIRLKGAGHAFYEGGADPRGEGLALGY